MLQQVVEQLLMRLMRTKVHVCVLGEGAVRGKSQEQRVEQRQQGREA